MVSKAITTERYAELGGSICPKCHSEEFELHGDTTFVCNNCGSQWVEEYELVGYWFVQEDDPATATVTRRG